MRREPAGYLRLLESNATAPELSGPRGQSAFLLRGSSLNPFGDLPVLPWNSVLRGVKERKMRLKCIPLMVLAALTAIAALPLFAQSNPAAEQGGWPVVIGGGMSVFNMDFPPGSANGVEEGGTIWADWTRIPFVPRHLGLEAEYRDLSLNAPSSEPGLSSKVFLGGPTYIWNFSRLNVYGKGMVGYASLHFPPFFGSYTHDTRTVEGAGGGAEYRVWDGVWARGDYEYQWWPSLVYGRRLHPRGFTFSMAYDFRTFGRRY